jgi:hypothetical protein
MSPRDFYWFMAGSLVALTAAFTFRPPPAATHAPLTASTPTSNTVAATQLDESDLRAAQLISQGETHADESHSAGALEDVTSRMAARLAASGGSPQEWRLLAESYDYLGRTREAQEARSHIAP